MIGLALVTLLLSPWRGPSLPGASPDAAKYRLTVRGTPQQRVDLRAAGLPSGWVASFCTRDLCSPFRYTLQLDSHGSGTMEFQAIRTDPHAPRTVHVVVSGVDVLRAAQHDKGTRRVTLRITMPQRALSH